MFGMSLLRGKFNGLLAVLLVVALVLPTIDTCICAADLGLADPAQTSAAQSAVVSHDSEGVKGGLCQNCHCFHLAGLVRMERVMLGATISSNLTAWAVPEAPDTVPGFTLLRPPRA